MSSKLCYSCKLEKPLTDFYKHKNRKDGHSGQCAECTKSFSKKWYKETIDERKRYYTNNLERKQKYRKKHSEERALSGIKQRAKIKNLPFDLTLEDISIYSVCPVFGISLERSTTGKQANNSPSVDRIDSTKGYTKDNIQILSNKANRMKQDATPEELLMFADWIYKTYKK